MECNLHAIFITQRHSLCNRVYAAEKPYIKPLTQQIQSLIIHNQLWFIMAMSVLPNPIHYIHNIGKNKIIICNFLFYTQTYTDSQIIGNNTEMDYH